MNIYIQKYVRRRGGSSGGVPPFFIKNRFFIIFRFFEKFDFFQGQAILMLTVKISIKNHPYLWVQINFSRIFEKIAIFDVFHLQNRFQTLPDGPLDPLDRQKNPKKNFKKSIFSTIFSYWTLGQLYSTIWTYNLMLETIQNRRF